ncbi:MAG: hypothetical protein WCF18_23960, partial [Chthoniobacteraceae bacterium]
KTLTLTSAFDVSLLPTAPLAKNDNGVLELAANNSASSWSGPISVNAGALRLGVPNAAGLGTISVGPTGATVGAALQLANGVNISNPLSIQAAGNALLGGINFGGQLQSLSGVNTYSGPITVGFDSAIGADSGATLNITGGINLNAATAHQLVFTGGGDINLSGTPMTATGGVATSYFAVQKFGSGTLTIRNANTAAISDVTGFRVNAGTVRFAGAGTWAGAFTSTATNFLLNPGGTLTLDNSTAGGSSNVDNRLGNGRLIQFLGGNLNLIGSEAVNTTETFGAPNFNRGFAAITVTAQPGFQTDLRFTAAANSVAGVQNGTTAPTASSVLFRGTNLGSAVGAGNASIAVSTGGFTFNGQTGATGSASKGILPWALVDASATGNGTSFATTDAAAATVGTAILRPLAANEFATANTITANNNINLTAAGPFNVAASVTPNSLTMDASSAVTVGALQTLSLSSGGILVKTGSSSSISGGILAQAAAASPFNFWTLGDLTISSVLNGGNGTSNATVGFVKAGAGTLTLSSPTSSIPGLTGLSVNSLSGLTAINQGTLKLAGGTNTIQANNFLEIGVGGTLDLNGTSQYVLGLFTDGAVNGAGGTITSSSGAATLVQNADNAARNFAGAITGNVFWNRAGQNTLTVLSPQTYSGGTLLNGNTTVLRDAGALTTTSSIDLNFATLTVDNTGSTDLPDRLSDSANISLRGGTLNVNGRAQTASTETVGPIVLDSGYNVITPAVGGTGVNSVELTTMIVVRSGSGSATLQVGGTNLGTIGSNSRFFQSLPVTLTNN